MKLLEIVRVELAGATSWEVGIIPTTWLVCNWLLFALRTREGRAPIRLFTDST